MIFEHQNIRIISKVSCNNEDYTVKKYGYLKVLYMQ